MHSVFEVHKTTFHWQVLVTIHHIALWKETTKMRMAKVKLALKESNQSNHCMLRIERWSISQNLAHKKTNDKDETSYQLTTVIHSCHIEG